MASLLQKELSVALGVVTRCARVTKRLQARLCTEQSICKSDSSPVTVGDFTVQALVLSELCRAFPGDGFIAEERSEVLRAQPEELRSVAQLVYGEEGADEGGGSRDPTGEQMAALCRAIDLGGTGYGQNGRTWVLDPIDGTKGFLRNEQFCIALALVLTDSERPARVGLGILGCPNLDWDPATPQRCSVQKGEGWTFYAVEGQGASGRRLHGDAPDVRLQASPTQDCTTLQCCTSVPSTGHSEQDTIAATVKALGTSVPPLELDSQAKYGLVACGAADLYLRIPKGGANGQNIWDHAAGCVVVQEAGGRVTDSNGNPLDFGSGEQFPNQAPAIIVTNGALHASVQATVRQCAVRGAA